MKTTLKTSIAILCALALASCGTPTGTTNFPNLNGLGGKVLRLTEFGLLLAATQNGTIKPGDVLTISQGVAIIRSPGSLQEKIIPLATLGLDRAVAEGRIKPGESILIKEGLAILAEPETPPVQAVAAEPSK